MTSNHFDFVELLAASLAATASVERCHIVKTLSIKYSDGTRSEYITEIDYVAGEGAWWRAVDDSGSLEVLALKNGVYTKTQQSTWGRDSYLSEVIDRTQGWSDAPPPGSDIVPYWGSINMQEYEFEYVGTEVLEDAVTRHFIGKPIRRLMPIDLLKGDLKLCIDERTNLIRQLSSTYNDYEKSTSEMNARVAAGTAVRLVPLESISSHQMNTDMGRAIEVESVSTQVFSRINDPSVVLPKPE